MLSLVAAHTTTLRLQTGILVLPYRNPFTVARAVATLDVFSGGRVSLGVGAGYLKGEYKALGVDFERRNEIMDEYLKALKAAWTGDDFDFEGENYSARGNRIRPAPLQRPHPPLLIGGNARRAIRRAVELGDADAMVELGLCFEAGIGVREDAAEAERWFRRAADAGNVRALAILGLCG